jgi:hypothetical protein
LCSEECTQLRPYTHPAQGYSQAPATDAANPEPCLLSAASREMRKRRPSGRARRRRRCSDAESGGGRPDVHGAGSESVGPAREWLRELPAQLRPKVETPGVDARVQGDRLEHEKQDETAVLREAALSVFRVLRLATMKRPKEDGRRDSR